jgi:hypothetical protein
MDLADKLAIPSIRNRLGSSASPLANDQAEEKKPETETKLDMLSSVVVKVEQ